MTPELEKKIEDAADADFIVGKTRPVGTRERYLYEEKRESFLNGVSFGRKGMYTEEEVDALKSEIVDLKQYIYSKEIDSRNERERDIEFLEEIKNNLSKYLNRQDVTKGDYAMQMIEDWIRELNKKKEE